MNEKTHLKSYLIKLITLSPVFIGDGEAIKGIKTEEEFFNKVIQNNPERVQNWTNYFLNETNPSLQGFLRKYDKSFIPNQKTNSFIKSAGKPYIPGSSIKGAIRSALLSKLILNLKKNSFKEAEEILKEQMKYIQISDSNFIDSKFLFKQKYKNYNIIHKKIKENDKTINEKEFLKQGVEVFFTLSIGHKKCDFDKDYIFEALNDFYGKILKENKDDLEGKQAVSNISKPMTEEEFLISKFGRATNIPCEKLIPALNEYKQKYPSIKETSKSESQDNYIKLYDENLKLTPNINIGGQSGFNTKVVLRALYGENYINKKKEILDKNFKSHNHKNMYKAPRYLKFVTVQGENYTIGWCGLKVEKEIC